MIQINNVSKGFENHDAISGLNMRINSGEVFGLIGTNGSGKSTLLRMIAGVLKPDEGEVLINGMPVYENPKAKQDILFLSDTGYAYANATPDDMAKSYSIFYPKFNKKRYDMLLDRIGLKGNKKLRTFSKGMKKQVSVLLGICANTRIMLCDEIFDGLDPVVRQAVKSILMTEMTDREFTPVIASHNLRELEDMCDHIGILHDGRLLISESLDDIRVNVTKIQCSLKRHEDEKILLSGLNVVRTEKNGSVLTIIARGEREDILRRVRDFEPILAEVLPMTLEEIFISETEVAGYEFKNLFS